MLLFYDQKDMIFRHKQFQLDDESQIVFDSQGRELRIFGNEYLILAHLCKNKKASHKELSVLLALGELYSGDRIKELVEYINAKIKAKVIDFKNEEYLLVGEVESAKIVFNLEQQSKQEVQEEKKEEGEEVFMGLTLKELLIIGVGVVVAIFLIKLFLDNLL